MFLTFTPNPCLERTFFLPDFERGKTYRLPQNDLELSVGGKGLNAARVAARFGTPTTALYPVDRHHNVLLQHWLREDHLKLEPIEVDCSTRQCTNIVHGNGEKTEIIENGAPITIEEGTRILEKWRDLLPQTRLAAIGGAYAPSSNPQLDWHATLLCGLAAQAGVPVIFDGKGEPFARALASKTPPWAIKPNREEAAFFLRRPLETPFDERRAVRDLLGKGVEVVLLSCGERGLYVGHRGGIEWFEAPQVETVSAVGSGDSLVGAFASKWLETNDIFEAALWGVAAGSANAMRLRSADFYREDAWKLLAQVRRSSPEIALPLIS